MSFRVPMSDFSKEKWLSGSFVFICLTLGALMSKHVVKCDKNLKILTKRNVAGNLTKGTLADNIPSNVVTNGTTANNSNTTETTLRIGSTINETNNTTANHKTDKSTLAIPFLVTIRIKYLWPINRDSLEKDLALAFNDRALTQNYINVTVHIINATCLWSCPRSKRSLKSDSQLVNSTTTPKNEILPSSSLAKFPRMEKYEADSSGNNTFIIFNPTYGNGTTPRWLTTLSNIKYNDYNSAQGSVLEASAVQVLFAVFQGRIGERSPVDAFTVVSIFRLYGSYSLLNQQLKTVDEVLSFPISFADFLASTEPPPLPPSPSSTLLIPAWAIFLLVFVSFIIALFIIWIVYSCFTGTLKEGGAALLAENFKESYDYAHKGPLSHQYNINLHKDVTSPQPQVVAKPTRSIRFDRSTSYDVGLLSTTESDKNLDKDNPVLKNSYKRRESRVCEGATKRRIKQKSEINSEFETDSISTYKSKFTRLNIAETLPSPATCPLVRETPPSPVGSLRRDQGIGSQSEQSDIDSIYLKFPKERQPMKTKKTFIKELKEEDEVLSKSGSIATDAAFVNQFFYPSPYPIFRPLKGSYPYPYPSLSQMASLSHYLNPVSVIAYHNPASHAKASINYSDSLKYAQSLAGDIHVAKPGKFRKMAKDLVENAFDDSERSTPSLSHKNTSFEKPTDMKEFRKILDDAFAFNKSFSPRS